MNLYTVKSFPGNDVVQAEERLVRDRLQCVLREAAVFCGFTSLDVMWAIRESEAVRFEARRTGELDCR
jgi:hypothetical protein